MKITLTVDGMRPLNYLIFTLFNQSTEGAEIVWVSECQKGEGCEIIKQFVFV
jgi:hypothetical protein